MTDTIAITTTMRRYCEVIARPDAAFWRRTATGPYQIDLERSHVRMNYPMGLKLKRAGLVEFTPDPSNTGYEIGTLTEKGRAIANRRRAAGEAKR